MSVSLCYYCGAKERARLVGKRPPGEVLRHLCWKCVSFNITDPRLFPKDLQNFNMGPAIAEYEGYRRNCCWWL